MTLVRTGVAVPFWRLPIALAHLCYLSVCEIKIDQTFITQLATCVHDQIIVRSIVDLSHQLGYRVTPPKAWRIKEPSITSRKSTAFTRTAICFQNITRLDLFDRIARGNGSPA